MVCVWSRQSTFVSTVFVCVHTCTQLYLWPSNAMELLVDHSSECTPTHRLVSVEMLSSAAHAAFPVPVPLTSTKYLHKTFSRAVQHNVFSLVVTLSGGAGKNSGSIVVKLSLEHTPVQLVSLKIGTDYFPEISSH